MADRAPTPALFRIAHRQVLPEGHLVIVTWNPDTDAVPLGTETLQHLTPDETAHALLLAPARQRTWVAGRTALRAALADAGVPIVASILTAPSGAPALPAGVTGSISHKPGIAVALAARAAIAGPHVGVDIEPLQRRPIDISGRVLTAREQAHARTITATDRWRFVLHTFSAKESLFKAVNPRVGRYVGFSEVEVDFDAYGRMTFSLARMPDAADLVAKGSSLEYEGNLITAAQVKKYE